MKMAVDPAIQLRVDFTRQGGRPFFQKSGPTAAAEAQRQALELGWLCVHSVVRGKNLLSITPAGMEAIGAATHAPAIASPSRHPGRFRQPKSVTPQPSSQTIVMGSTAILDPDRLDSVLRDMHLGKISVTEAQEALVAAGFPADRAREEIELFLAD